MIKTKKIYLRQPKHAYVKKSRLDAFIIGFLLVVLLVLLVALCRTLTGSDIFLIQHITVQGQHPHLEQNKLRAALKPYLRANFFRVDLSQLREYLLDFPWVADVKIIFVWPNALTIQIIEQKPIAFWNNKELMNEQGDIFAPDRASFPKGLPELYGDSGQHLIVLDAFHKISEMLKPWHLAVNKLSLTSEKSLNLILTNGMQVKLGNDNMYTHFKHFLQVYNDFFLKLNKADNIEYVDISYPNGMAVKWKTAVMVKNS